ncbi:TPA: DUF2971 domain-containing protein [Escherichia coli]|nr:DUF2971 domain-containing protein [Escherichia coli]
MKIYHYTDLNGLKGIIESGSLWATHFSFLNDSNELTHGMNCLENALQYLRDDFNPKTLKFIEQALTHFRMHRAAHVYNLSFCLEPDLLSQWRGYGSSQGVCLEFDDEELLASQELTHYQVFKNRVLYTKEDSTVEARNEILAFFRQPHVQAAINADVMHEMIQATRLAHSLPPFFKNDGFKEEQEFRMVILPDSPFEGVNFRVNDSGLVPYLIIKAKDKLPLTNVRIGPRSNRAMMMDGISFLLQSRGYTSTRISFTETPFR